LPRFFKNKINLASKFDWDGIGIGVFYENPITIKKSRIVYIGVSCNYPKFLYNTQFLKKYFDPPIATIIKNPPFTATLSYGWRKYNNKAHAPNTWYKSRKVIAGLGHGTHSFTEQMYMNGFRIYIGIDWGWGYQFPISKQLLMKLEAGFGIGVAYQTFPKYYQLTHIYNPRKSFTYPFIPAYITLILKQNRSIK